MQPGCQCSLSALLWWSEAGRHWPRGDHCERICWQRAGRGICSHSHCLEGQRRATRFQGEAEGNLPSPTDKGHTSQCGNQKVEGQSFSSLLSTARMRVKPRKRRVMTSKTCHCMCFPKQLSEVEPAVEDPSASPPQSCDSHR